MKRGMVIQRKYIYVPNRAEVKVLIMDLIERRRTRNNIAQWASRFMEDTAVVDDPLVLQAITRLSRVNLLGGTDPYLYNTDDFMKWLKQLD